MTTELFPDLSQFAVSTTESKVLVPFASKIGTLEARIDALQTRQNRLRSRLLPRHVKLLASRVFGYNGWSSQISSFAVTQCTEDGDKWTVCHSAVVLVRLADGTESSGSGIGKGINLPKAAAYNKSLKEAAAEATKAAILGLAAQLLE